MASTLSPSVISDTKITQPLEKKTEMRLPTSDGLPIRRDTRRIDTLQEQQDIMQIRFYGEYMQCMKRTDKGNETKCKEIFMRILKEIYL